MDYIKANKLVWESASDIHKEKTLGNIKESFLENKNFLALDKATSSIFRHLNLEDKKLLHIGCNNGRETLSLKRLGAGSCLGVDYSEGFISQARELSKATQIQCSFETSDIFEWQTSQSFDITLITVGFCQFIDNIEKLFKIIRNVTKDGGCFVLTDIHPFIFVIDDEKDGVQGSGNDYFSKEPIKKSKGLDYVDGIYKPYEASPFYYFHRPLSSYITNLIEAGFKISRFEEYPDDVSQVCAKLEGKGLPLSYGLIAKAA